MAPSKRQRTRQTGRKLQIEWHKCGDAMRAIQVANQRRRHCPKEAVRGSESGAESGSPSAAIPCAGATHKETAATTATQGVDMAFDVGTAVATEVERIGSQSTKRMGMDL